MKSEEPTEQEYAEMRQSVSDFRKQISPAAPTDHGIPELDELCRKYNNGEIDICKLVCDAWNKAYYAGTKGL